MQLDQQNADLHLALEYLEVEICEGELRVPELHTAIPPDRVAQAREENCDLVLHIVEGNQALADQIHRTLGWKTHIPEMLETYNL